MLKKLPDFLQDEPPPSLLIKIRDTGYPMEAYPIDIYGKRYLTTHEPRWGETSLFWAMIVQEQPSVIVKLTRLIPTQEKPSYWPNEKGEKWECSEIDLVVECVDSEQFSEFIIQRTFKVSMGEATHNSVQLDYFGWHDMSIPSVQELTTLLKLTSELSEKSSGPIVVHCGMGIGRTGTFIAAHCALRRRAQKEIVDFYSIISDLRNQRRANMVETLDQVNFLVENFL